MNGTAILNYKLHHRSLFYDLYLSVHSMFRNVYSKDLDSMPLILTLLGNVSLPQVLLKILH